MPRLRFRRNKPKDGIVTADEFALPAGNVTECQIRFKERGLRGDINELRCGTKDNPFTTMKPGVSTEKLKAFVLKSKDKETGTPFNVKLIDHPSGKVVASYPRVTELHFDSRMKITGFLKAGWEKGAELVKGLGDHLQSIDSIRRNAVIHISSPNEVEKIAKEMIEAREKGKYNDLDPRTQELLEEVPACAEKGEPMLFWNVKQGTTIDSAALCLDGDQKTHFIMKFSNPDKYFCKIPSTLEKAVARVAWGRQPHCTSVPPEM